jgi:hypothetical protein
MALPEPFKNSIGGGLDALASGYTLVCFISATAWSVLPSTLKPRTPKPMTKVGDLTTK